MLPTSPLEINPHVERLLAKINAEFEPEIIPIIPESYSSSENCFMNVEEKVKRDGGKPHYGWAILQTNIVCEAERHAVWENDNEQLIDVTHRDYGIKQIMFVSDNNLIYRGQLIDNIRINITDNKIVDDYIALCETHEVFYTYGTRLNDFALDVPEPAKTLIFQYDNLKMQFQAFINSGGRPESACICGGGKSYKNCHGKAIRAHFQGDLLRVEKELKGIPRPLKP